MRIAAGPSIASAVLLRIFVLTVLAAAIFGGAWFAVHELYVRPQDRLKADKALPPPAPPPDPSILEFEKFVRNRPTMTPEEARKGIERFLREFPSATTRDAAHDILGELNSAEFFSAKPDATNTYLVKAGDSISRVASRTKVPAELLVHLNHLGKFVHPNQRLLAPACAFRLVIQEKPRRVVLYNGDKFFRQYPAASWPGSEQKPVLHPKQTGRVTEKRAFKGSETVASAQPGYFDAIHVILVSIPGHSLYTLPGDPKVTVPRPPGGGIGMAPAHINEIAVLLPSGAPVSIE